MILLDDAYFPLHESHPIPVALSTYLTRNIGRIAEIQDQMRHSQSNFDGYYPASLTIGIGNVWDIVMLRSN